MMQHLGRYAIKNLLLIRRRTLPSIRFSVTLTSPELNDTLHSRVMARGRERWKVTPPLDEWLKQGKEINPTELRCLINALCESQRFDHALQVSEWITKRGVFNLSPEDFAYRLYLVEIRSGLKEADKFFKSIPENMRDDSVYNTLLSLYTKSKNTRHEAEAIYQKMREQNILSKPYPYYNMIALYGLLGERNMVDEIVRQMKENGVEHDKILTANNVLKAYASIPDVEVMEKFMMGLEVEEPRFVLAWQTGISVAKAYLKGGSSKKAIEMLRRTELVVDAKSKDAANKVLMEMYGDAGAKQDVFRLNRLIYSNSKKGKKTRAHKSEGEDGGYSYDRLRVPLSLMKKKERTGGRKARVIRESG
ncbi:putative pentatricopeptide repeat-containing protein [Cardamine amara subsp. amara]|uniref:Pentatricopeptide repeat-containing protein n=1 Tax=Cardamine amara subsp. amara TaxID=228776 RepID=A0ABD1BNB6_CARAN